MRVIIRFSLNGANRPQTQLRSMLKRRLEAQGINWTGKTTSTYEGDVDENSIRLALRSFWSDATNFPGNAHIDHFWMYADRGAPKRPSAEELGL